MIEPDVMAGARIRVTRTYGPYLDGRFNIPQDSVGTIMSSGASMGQFVTDGFICNFEGYDGDYTIMFEDIEILTPGIKLTRHTKNQSLLIFERV